ncbi:filamentous hemagglutinin N-terminal domain-containing protein [Variovorax robiniae]|uniref:Filamentous hemagglutinin N-terminal domain-containing protein n=1 Tax=Variovorax robiniae TaxID=1836199 RepID=A0ABU8X9Z3_9BURK
MNKNLHRIIFNAARGMRMVVQETAMSAGKASGATPAIAASALAAVLAASPVQAQIAGANNVPGNQRPTVLVAPNGVPLVNIQTPSASGVSRNVFGQFDVGSNGAILNNSRTNAQTQQGGWVQGNPFLAGGPARIILNEVNSGNPSQLRGYIEVGGQRAEVIIANPAGISVDGGGFINTSRATLTTGTPQLNALGGLDSFLVRGGTVTIDGAGLDVSKTDYATILARAVQANANIYAGELKVVTGANQISADHSQVTPTSGSGATPTFALDVSALGGMYANKITLIGTEAGLGVRNAGSIGASAGGLVVTASGRLENTGTLEGQRVEIASTADIENRGTIRQTGTSGLNVVAPVLSNTNGGTIGAEPVAAISAGQADPMAGTSSGTATAPSTTTNDTSATTPPTTAAASTASTYTPPAPGSITASGTLRNDGGHIYADGLQLQTPQINNAGGTLNVAALTVSGPQFNNAGGTLNVSNTFNANVGELNNAGGQLHAGNLQIHTTGDLNNQDGTLHSDTDASLTVGGQLDNTRGTITALGSLNANVTGATTNGAGTLSANQGVTLGARSLDNTKGNIQSANGAVQLTIGQQLANGDGHVAAGTDLSATAGSLSNSGSLRARNDLVVTTTGLLANDGSLTAGRHATINAGSLQGGSASSLGAGIQNDGTLANSGDLAVTTVQGLAAHGTNLAAGQIVLQGASVDLSNSKTSAANIALTATQGNVTTSDATLTTPGTLAITANAQPGQTLANSGGKLNAGRIDLNAVNIANTHGGQIEQAGTGTQRIATTGNIDNTGGRIASNAQDFGVQAATLTNTGGTIEHAGTGTLNVRANAIDGADGHITGNGALVANVAGAFNQDGGGLGAKQVTIDAGSLSNRGGTISQPGSDATRITVAGTLDNSAGKITSNAQEVGLQAATLVNNAGSIEHAGAGTLSIVANSIDGANGHITGNGALVANVAGAFSQDGGGLGAKQVTIDAGALSNRGGTISQSGNDATRITVAGALDNSAGKLTSNGQDVGLQASTLVNNAGTIEHAGTGTLNITANSVDGPSGHITGNGALVAKVAGAFNQDGGSLQAQQLTVDAGSLDNHGGKIAQSGTGTTRITVTGTLDNTFGQLTSNAQDMRLQSGTLTNSSGKIDHAGKGTLDLQAGAVDGTNGTITSNGALTAKVAGDFNQDKGQLSAAQITIDSGALGNRGGSITQKGGEATRITVVGAIDNSVGTLGSNGNTTIAAGTLNNQGGKLHATGTTNLDLGVGGMLDNSNAGEIGAGGNATLRAGTLNNDSGSITAVGDLGATVSGVATNVGGTIGANHDATLNAASLDNTGGQVAGVRGKLRVETTGLTLNAGGKLVAGADSTLVNGGLDNDGGTVYGNTLTVDTRGNALSNRTGTLASASTVNLNSGTLTNDAGLIRSEGAMTINTNGQALSNTNAAGYTQAHPERDVPGGLSSGGTLDLTAGTVNNAGGAIGAQQALTVNTQAFSNTNGGLVVGQSDVSVNTHGAAFDNTGGQTLAIGNLAITAGDITNTNGLIRSTQTTTLNAATVGNTGTQGTDRGIEGKNVAITAGQLDNTHGAIRADVDATITSGGTVDNTSGLISALNTLTITDPNAANPAAKTLQLVNTNGMLTGTNGLRIDAATFSADGTVTSGKDLTLAVQQDIVNNGELSANGSLTYSTTGTFTNNGKLSAGDQLTVGGSVVENTAAGEMTGTNGTTVNAGTLNNRGLIDSNGVTRINAGTVNNVGTGRIYGDQIAIAATTLNNVAETVNGNTTAATIASRNDIDIGATTLNNRDHALIFSAGDMYIGGGLDADGYATGTAAAVNNESASIESLGNITIDATQVNNLDTHLLVSNTTTQRKDVRLATLPDGKFWDPADTWGDDATRVVYHRNADGSVTPVGFGGWGMWYYTVTTTGDIATQVDPASLTAGGDINITGHLNNRDSRVIAGGTITAGSVENHSTSGTQHTVVDAFVVGYMVNKPGTGPNNVTYASPQITDTTLPSLGGYAYEEHASNVPSSGSRPGAANGGGGVDASASGAGAVNAAGRRAAITEVPANVGQVVQADGSIADATQRRGVNAAIGNEAQTASGGTVAPGGTQQVGGINGPASRTVPMVVRTSPPNLGIPQASLFRTNASTGSHYLVETDPRFANYRTWLSSDSLGPTRP